MDKLRKITKPSTGVIRFHTQILTRDTPSIKQAGIPTIPAKFDVKMTI